MRANAAWRKVDGGVISQRGKGTWQAAVCKGRVPSVADIGQCESPWEGTERPLSKAPSQYCITFEKMEAARDRDTRLCQKWCGGLI